MELDQAGAQRTVVIVELVGELDAVLGVDRKLERRDTREAPGGVGYDLHQIAFAVPDGAELFLVRADVLVVRGGIVSREEDGAAGECRLDSVQR